MAKQIGAMIRFGCILAAIFLLPGQGIAQTEPGLSPALQHIKTTNTVRLGYRENALPFSFLNRFHKPVGYSLEICQAIVEEIAVAIDAPDLKIAYVPLTAEGRIPAILRKEVDLECSSSTANAERARQMAFSPMIFVAGTRLLVPRQSPVRDVRDLAGKTVAVTQGTTNQAALQAANIKFGLGLKIILSPDHEQSFRMVADGKADAFATDDILLYGLIARHQARDRFRITGDYLSYEPYAILFRKGDAQLAGLVEQGFRKLATNHDFAPLYRKWFMRRLPTGEQLGIPISPQLEGSFRMLDHSPGATE